MAVSGAVFSGNKVNSRNLYHETFLAYIWLVLKRHHISFYQPDFITKLKYDLLGSLSKYNLFTRHLNYYKTIFYVFFLSVKYKNEWKEREFWRQKDQQKQFLQKQGTI